MLVNSYNLSRVFRKICFLFVSYCFLGIGNRKHFDHKCLLYLYLYAKKCFLEQETNLIKEKIVFPTKGNRFKRKRIIYIVSYIVFVSFLRNLRKHQETICSYLSASSLLTVRRGNRCQV